MSPLPLFPHSVTPLLPSTVDFWLRLEKVEDVKRNRLGELPDVVLKLVVSQLDTFDVLDRLLPAYPCLVEKLRNGVDWPEDDRVNTVRTWSPSAPSQILEDCRRLALLAADSIRQYEVSFRPTEPGLQSKWRRVVGGQSLRELVVSDLDLLSNEAVAPALEKLTVTLKAKYKDVNVWTMWCPSTQLDQLTQVTVLVEGDGRRHAFQISNGNSFFNAFPKATQLTFFPSPSAEFWSTCPAAALERVTHVSLHFLEESDAFVRRAASLTNLRSLALTWGGVVDVLRDLVQGHVILPGVVSLTLVAEDRILRDESTWSQLATTFPHLTELDVSTEGYEYEDGYDPYEDCECIQGKLLEETIPSIFGNRATVKISDPWISLSSCLVMATMFLKKGDDAVWQLIVDGRNGDDIRFTRPPVTQAMLDLLIKNPSCEVEFKGTVEADDYQYFTLRVKSL
jgi:hypothetical protein